MATSININGREIFRPGVYALIKSGVKNSSSTLSTGNICIIDDGIGATWGGGAGVMGTSVSGSEAVYELTSPQQMRDFVKGGALWDLAEPLFKPAETGIVGVAKVFLIRAAETTVGTVSLTFSNGAISFSTLDQGEGVNGILVGSVLSKGYAVKFVADSNSSKYIVQFFHGTFKGIDELNNVPYDGIQESESKPSLLFSSDPCSTIQELADWCDRSKAFKAVFTLANKTITTTGAFVEGDLAANTGFNLVEGGTENYSSEAFDAAIEAVENVDNTFFLATSYGVTEGVGLNNTKLFDYIAQDSKYGKFMVVGAGQDKTEFMGQDSSSEAVAKYYNSDKVIVVHGGSKKAVRSGFLIKSSLYKAAAVLGRICGLEPQTPCTFKSIGIDGEVHQLSNAELEFALKVGVLVTYYDTELGYYVIEQGINTLQKNEYLINEDTTSFNIALKRIEAALNKEIMIKGKRRFFGNATSGANRNTVSQEDVTLWLKGLLQTKVSTANTDNLLIRFDNIKTSVDQDIVNVEYEFVGNTEITKMIVTGTIIAN